MYNDRIYEFCFILPVKPKEVTMTSVYRGTKNSTKLTPVNQPIPGKESEMVLNRDGGGYNFSSDDYMLERFLILGITGNTYYATKKQLAEESFNFLARIDLSKALDRAVNVSVNGLAMSNDPALAVLAMAFSSKNPKDVQKAKLAIVDIVRTGTHLLHLASFIDTRRSWGRAVRKGFANWFNSFSHDDLAFQMGKYQNRDGWTFGDVLRSAHVPDMNDPIRKELFKWALKKDFREDILPRIIIGMEKIKLATSKHAALDIAKNYRLPLEMIPNQYRSSQGFWETVVPNLGITSVIRNLGNMSKNGISDSVRKMVVDGMNAERIKRGRVHPMSVYIGFKTYNNGHGLKSDNTWVVDRVIKNALEEAIYKSFKYLAPTGKKYMFGLDVSGSMTDFGTESIPVTPIEYETVLCLAILESGDDIKIFGFDDRLREINLRKGMSIEDAIRKVYNGSFGSTDVSLVYQQALLEKTSYDCFIISTDNEINTGYHPAELLKKYRDERVSDAKQIVLAMELSSMSIADPNDPNSLDICGMSADIPAVISKFTGSVFNDRAVSDEA